MGVISYFSSILDGALYSIKFLNITRFVRWIMKNILFSFTISARLKLLIGARGFRESFSFIDEKEILLPMDLRVRNFEVYWIKDSDFLLLKERNKKAKNSIVMEMLLDKDTFFLNSIPFDEFFRSGPKEVVGKLLFILDRLL